MTMEMIMRRPAMIIIVIIEKGNEKDNSLLLLLLSLPIVLPSFIDPQACEDGDEDVSGVTRSVARRGELIIK
jgi:hypothetical protein